MSPKRPLRSRRPSATAIDAAASGESQRKRARSKKQKTVPQVPEPQGPAPQVPVPQVPPPQVPAPQGPAPQVPVPQVPVLPASQDVAFPPGLLDTLVARVADEVTNRLTPVYASAFPQPFLSLSKFLLRRMDQ